MEVALLPSLGRGRARQKEELAKAKGKSLTFRLDRPRPLTIEVNGDPYGSLHLFANPMERDAPKPSDPNVIYFGPGVHEVTHLVVPDGKTLYVAGGAILRCVVGKDEKGWTGGDGARGYPASIELLGKNVALRGRGIIDGNACPPHSRDLVFVKGQDATVEGVTLRDAATWNLPIRQSDRVTVRNVKVLGHRANSDGVDVCNSRDVTVEDCFLRTLDDLFVVKSDQGQGPVQRVLTRRCVLWDQVAHALSLGAELREPVDDVRFEDCDVIHDTGREWTLRIFHCDSAPISNVVFGDIRVEETQRLLSLWIRGDKLVAGARVGKHPERAGQGRARGRRPSEDRGARLRRGARGGERHVGWGDAQRPEGDGGRREPQRLRARPRRPTIAL